MGCALKINAGVSTIFGPRGLVHAAIDLAFVISGLTSLIVACFAIEFTVNPRIWYTYAELRLRTVNEYNPDDVVPMLSFEDGLA